VDVPLDPTMTEKSTSSLLPSSQFAQDSHGSIRFTSFSNVIMAEVSSGPTTGEELLQRKSEIETRLVELGAKDAPTTTSAKAAAAAAADSKRKSSRRGSKPSAETTKAPEDASEEAHLIPYAPKTTDTHWDFVMKEMMWLGAEDC